MALSSLERWSAPFAPGVINADGLRKLLGASDHDALSLLVRETVQNSWDASRDDRGGPLIPGSTAYFGLSLRALNGREREAMKRLFGEEPVPGLEALSAALSDPALSVLEIADRNTSGLGGPLDNRQAMEDTERSDFVDLVFNIGAPQDTDLGGGTFGFGKIATYAMSSAATVIMVSRPLESDGSVGSARLIASAIGNDYSEGGIRYTGRHWWGRHGNGTVLPVVGDDAEHLADVVFGHAPPPGVSGTTIMVLAPALDALPRHDSDVTTGLDRSEAIRRMVSALLWSAWPKLVPHEPGAEPPMELEVLLDGIPQHIPDPTTTHPFIGFCHALQVVRQEQRRRSGERREPHGLVAAEPGPRYVTREAMDVLSTKRPKQVVGLATIAETMRVPGTPAWEGDPLVAESMGVAGTPRHLALMRQAELVVRYDEGPEHPDASNSMSWGGVFRCEVEVDDAFAAAEPPTHDRWVPGGLGRPRSTYVRRATTTGPREFYDRVFTPAAAGVGAPTGDLARLVSEHLGGLIDEGEATQRQRGTGGGGGSRPSGISVRAATTRVLDGVKVVAVEFTAPKGTVVHVTGAVALAGGGRDTETPVMTLGFSSPDEQRPTIASCDTIRSDGEPLLAWVEQPDDATVRVAVDRVS